MCVCVIVCIYTSPCALVNIISSKAFHLLVNLFKGSGLEEAQANPLSCSSPHRISPRPASLPSALYLPTRTHCTKRLLKAKTSSENGFDTSRVQFLMDRQKS